MRYKFYSNSQKSWQAMFGAILSAKESIYLEMYIFQDDMVDFDFIKLLKEKSKEGIRIRIILDSFGSYNLSNNSVKEIREAGIELFFLSYFLHRTHRKILVVDENIAFIGGVNFHQEASLWNDLVVRVKGRLVNSVIKSFAKVYVQCGGDDLILKAHINQKKYVRRVKERLTSWLIDHSPVRNKSRLKKIYQTQIAEAKESITLVTPYFMPRRWLIGALHQAYLRGVKVDILVPRNTESYFIDRMNYFYIFKLSKMHINFFLEDRMNHAKVMLIDSKEGIVGSNNLDYLSFELNSEVAIFLKDSIALSHVLRIIDSWKRDAILFDYKVYRMNFFDYIFYPINIFLSLF